jgi:hypothetical protein
MGKQNGIKWYIFLLAFVFYYRGRIDLLYIFSFSTIFEIIDMQLFSFSFNFYFI